MTTEDWVRAELEERLQHRLWTEKPVTERMVDITVPLPADMNWEAGEPAARKEALTTAGELFFGAGVELIDLFESHTLIVDGEFHDLAAEGRIAYQYRYLVRGTPR